MIFETPGIEMGLEAHRKYWGRRHLSRCISQLMEEQAELTIELSKFEREQRDEQPATVDRVARIIKEISDVLVCLEFIGRSFRVGTNEMRNYVTQNCIDIDNKLERLMWQARQLAIDPAAPVTPPTRP